MRSVLTEELKRAVGNRGDGFLSGMDYKLINLSII